MQVPTKPAGVANRARELYYGVIVFAEPHGANTKSVLDDLADDAYNRAYPDAPAKILVGDQAGAEAWQRIRSDLESLAVAQAKPNPDFNPKAVTWPLATMPTGWAPGSKFAAARPWGKPQERYHTGIDLRASLGAAVLAPEAGTIVAPNSGWEMKRNPDGTWRGVKSILLKTDSGRTWLLGGIRPDSALVKAGERVTAGQKIAFVGAYPGGDHMLHVTLYDAPMSEAQVNGQKSWKFGGAKPKNLIDAAPFLEAAKKNVKQVLAVMVPPSDQDIETGETDEGTPQAAGPGSNTATAPAPASTGKAGGAVVGGLATVLLILAVGGKR